MRRNRLRDLASCVLGSFVSRNNDLDGYWGIGKLCLHASDMNTETVTIDLLGQTITPTSTALDSILRQYSTMLVRQAELRRLKVSNLKSASIELHFGLPLSMLGDAQLWSWELQHGWGDAYSCVVKLIDDRGHTYVAQGLGRAAPHDPTRELRSGRSIS